MEELNLKSGIKFLHSLLLRFIEFSPRIIAAIIILFIGIWTIRYIRRAIDKIMTKKGLDPTLQVFLSYLLKWVMYIILFMAIIQVLGVPASSFLAVLGSAGLAIGLAIQGSLSNFAGGVMILITKPFKVGDTIEAKGQRGTVKEIGLINTTINKFNNEQAIIPNGPLFADNIVNYSKEEVRRIKILVGIGYYSDMLRAKEILSELAHSDERVIKEERPIQVFVEEFADNAVMMSLRFWCANDDYWDVYFHFMEEIKLRFDAAGIDIPVPQRDIRIKENIITTQK